MANKNYMNQVLVTPFFYLSTIALVGCSNAVNKFSTDHHYKNHNSNGNVRNMPLLLLDDGREEPWELMVGLENTRDLLSVVECAKTAASNAKTDAANMEVYASEVDAHALSARTIAVGMRCKGGATSSRLLEILDTTAADLETVSKITATITEQLQQIAEIREKAAAKIAVIANMLTSKTEERVSVKLASLMKSVISIIGSIQTKEQKSIAAVKSATQEALHHYVTETQAITERVVVYVNEVSGMQNVDNHQSNEVLAYLQKLIQHVGRVNYMLQVKPNQATSHASAVQPVQLEIENESTISASGHAMLGRVRDILEQCGIGLAKATSCGMTRVATGLTYAAGKGLEGAQYVAPIAASAVKYTAVKGMEAVQHVAPIAASAVKYTAVKGMEGSKYVYHCMKDQISTPYPSEAENREDRKTVEARARRILGVTEHADQETIRKAYLKALRLYKKRNNDLAAKAKLFAIRKSYKLLQS